MIKIELTLVGRHLLGNDGRKVKTLVVSDNTGYYLKFKNISKLIAIFARFSRDGEYKDYALDDEGGVVIPAWVMKCGFFNVGIYSRANNATIASTAFEIEVIDSILESRGIQAQEQEESRIEQLFDLINSLELDRESVLNLIGTYLNENPIDAENGLESAEINEAGELILTLQDETQINCGQQGISSEQVKTMIDEAISHIARFDGSYEVTPKVIAQTLNTKDKLMTDDVEIKEISTYEVSNQSGTTFYIGKEI